MYDKSHYLLPFSSSPPFIPFFSLQNNCYALDIWYAYAADFWASVLGYYHRYCVLNIANTEELMVLRSVPETWNHLKIPSHALLLYPLPIIKSYIHHLLWNCIFNPLAITLLYQVSIMSHLICAPGFLPLVLPLLTMPSPFIQADFSVPPIA